MLISAVVASGPGCSHLNWEPLSADANPSTEGTASSDGAAVEPGALAWWSRVVEATPAQRDVMLRNARHDRSAWRVAMLRSLPGASEPETPEASQEALRALIKRGLRDEEDALTRIRVAELGRSQACRAEATELRTRLSRIIEIERDMGHGR